MPVQKATSAAQWRSKPEIVELPSGKKARLRETVNVYAAMRAGVMTPEHVDDYHQAQTGKLNDLGRAMAFQDALICWLFVEPRCVLEDKVPAGAIHVSDLDDDDLDFLIARAFGGAPEDGAFPDGDGVAGDAGGAGSGADGEGVADDAESDGGDGAGKPRGVSGGSTTRRASQRKRSAAKRGR